MPPSVSCGRRDPAAGDTSIPLDWDPLRGFVLTDSSFFTGLASCPCSYTLTLLLRHASLPRLCSSSPELCNPPPMQRSDHGFSFLFFYDFLWAKLRQIRSAGMVLRARKCCRNRRAATINRKIRLARDFFRLACTFIIITSLFACSFFCRRKTKKKNKTA